MSYIQLASGQSIKLQATHPDKAGMQMEVRGVNNGHLATVPIKTGEARQVRDLFTKFLMESGGGVERLEALVRLALEGQGLEAFDMLVSIGAADLEGFEDLQAAITLLGSMTDTVQAALEGIKNQRNQIIEQAKQAAFNRQNQPAQAPYGETG